VLFAPAVTTEFGNVAAAPRATVAHAQTGMRA